MFQTFFYLKYSIIQMTEPLNPRNKCFHSPIIPKSSFHTQHTQHIKENIPNTFSSIPPHQVLITKQSKQDQCHRCFTNQSNIIRNKHSKHYFEVENSCSELMKVLIDQNSNLKDQNMYLQRQLSKNIQKDKDQSETLLEYESIMSVLNAQNVRLHKEILHLSNNANHKVDKLKLTINKFFKNNKLESQGYIEKEQEDDTFTVAPSLEHEEEDPRRFKRNRSQKGFMTLGRQFRMEPKSPSVHVNMRREECAFDTLLEECRNQQNPQKRKQMRRRLIQLAYNPSPAP